MIIKELLTKNYSQINLPPAEIDLLLSLALHKPVEYIHKNPEKKLAISTIKTFRKLVIKRQQNYSLAYLQGFKEFYGLKFLVNKHTLIPRPASELIVDEALKFLKSNKNSKIIDIGTGSGCLIISLAKKFTHGEYYASDISAPALVAAKTNARKHLSANRPLGDGRDKVKIKFIKSNLLNKIPKKKFNLIIANLPYLTKAQLREPSIKKEPRTALYGGQDGLEYYDKLLVEIKKFLADKFMILLEIDPQQTASIQTLIKKYLPESKIEIIPDLNKDNRVAKITNSNEMGE